MLRTKIVIALAAVALVSLPAVARAEEPHGAAQTDRPFHRGEVVLDDAIGVVLGNATWAPSSAPPVGGTPLVFGILSFDHFDYTSPTTAPDGSTVTSHGRTDVLTLAPSIDVLVTDHVSIGGRVSASNIHEHDDVSGGYDRFAFSIEPRLGYVVPLGRDFAFWPRASVGFGYGQFGDGNDGPHDTTWSTNLQAPLVARVGGHVELKLGPQLTATWWKSSWPSDSGPAASGSYWRAGVSGSIGFVF